MGAVLDPVQDPEQDASSVDASMTLNSTSSI